MDKMIYELLEQMNKTVLEMKQEMNQRFDAVENRIEAVEHKLDNLGEMFEHTVKIQQDAVSKLEVEDVEKRVGKVESVLFRLTQN